MEPTIPEFGRFAEPSLLILVSLRRPQARLRDHDRRRAGDRPATRTRTLYAALSRLEERGLIEALPPEDRRRPYRLTAVGATNLTEQLRGLSAFAQHGLRQLGADRAMRTLLIRCYPAAWRERYGDEFAAVLDERPLGPFDVADVLLGALDARLRMRDRRAGLTERKGFNMSLRIGGIAAILGAAEPGESPGSWAMASSPSRTRSFGSLLVIGLGLLLVAIAGLTAFQARAYPGLSWAAFGVLTVGDDHRHHRVRRCGARPGWVLELRGPRVPDGAGRDDAVRDRDLSDRRPVARRGSPARCRSGLAIRRDGLGQIILMPVAMAFFLLGWFLLGLQAIRLDSPATDPRPA